MDLGRAVSVDSPSHAVVVTDENGRARVRFAAPSARLDRDVVLRVRAAGQEPLASIATHRDGAGEGFFCLDVLPDLMTEGRRAKPQEVVFVIDTSGSMSGDPLERAVTALRLCLRQLREGDRFNVVAFSTGQRWFQKAMVPFTQKTLEAADQWAARLDANGGTEILAPMVKAVEQAPDGVIVLLTDGEVGNEDAVLNAVMKARRTARVCTLGIGTNVSDALLRSLARNTRGRVEFIHPTERVDDAVVGVFANAMAPRVTDVTVRFEGVSVSELAPATPADLVDGEGWSLAGRYASAGVGRAVLRGTLDGEQWAMVVPVSFAERSARPAVAKLWARARIAEMSDEGVVDPRRAEGVKRRVIALSTEHGVVSRYTSFVLVETREGDRRMNAMPETRVVPVYPAAGQPMMDAMPAQRGFARRSW
ncbi:MAG: VWA domain-containing protein [Polyangiales bacterium]